MSPPPPPTDAAREGGRRNRHTGTLGRNLPLAIGSGVVLAAAFIAALFWSPWVFLAFVGVVLVVALLELDGVLRAQGLRPATPVAIGAGLVMLFGAYHVGAPAQSLGLVLLVLGTIAWSLLDHGGPVTGRRRGGGRREPHARTSRVTDDLGITVFVTLWVPFLASFAGLLLARDEGHWAVLAAVALTVSNDIGAFAFGSRLGRHRMAPSVSPAKTWEGFLGGVLTVLVLAALITAQLPGFDLVTSLVFGVALAVAGTVGDLAESLVKRDLGVKDLGRILPGHGGIMDRTDAIVLALPVAYFTLVLLGD